MPYTWRVSWRSGIGGPPHPQTGPGQPTLDLRQSLTIEPDLMVLNLIPLPQAPDCWDYRIKGFDGDDGSGGGDGDFPSLLGDLGSELVI